MRLETTPQKLVCVWWFSVWRNGFGHSFFAFLQICRGIWQAYPPLGYQSGVNNVVFLMWCDPPLLCEDQSWVQVWRRFYLRFSLINELKPKMFMSPVHSSRLLMTAGLATEETVSVPIDNVECNKHQLIRSDQDCIITSHNYFARRLQKWPETAETAY